MELFQCLSVIEKNDTTQSVWFFIYLDKNYYCQLKVESTQPVLCINFRANKQTYFFL